MAFKVSNASDTMLILLDLRHSHHNPFVFTTKACKGYEKLSQSNFLSQGLVSLIAILQIWKELPKNYSDLSNILRFQPPLDTISCAHHANGTEINTFEKWLELLYLGQLMIWRYE